MVIHADQLADRYRWRVWHALRCEYLRTVRWVDDVTAQWAEYELPIRCLNHAPMETVHQAQRILIFLDVCFVIIDPVDDWQGENVDELADVNIHHGFVKDALVGDAG